MTTNRESYLDAIVPNSTEVDDERLLPSWLSKEAAQEEGWEAEEKRRLEISSFAQDFKRQFPSEAFAGVYQTDRGTGQKKVVKSTEEVIEDAYKWLEKKVKGDVNRAREILESVGLVDNLLDPILQLFADATSEDIDKETVKNREEEDEGQPSNVLENMRPVKKEASSDLHRAKRIGDYGIVATEQTIQLWKKGELVRELNTEALGGFGVVADEVESLQEEEDVESLFSVAEDITPDTQSLESESSNTLTAPTSCSVKVGEQVSFKMGDKCVSGKITVVGNKEVSVAVDGQEGIEFAVARESLITALAGKTYTSQDGQIIIQETDGDYTIMDKVTGEVRSLGEDASLSMETPIPPNTPEFDDYMDTLVNDEHLFSVIFDDLTTPPYPVITPGDWSKRPQLQEHFTKEKEWSKGQ